MGQIFVVNNTHALVQYDNKSFKVTGVYENMPVNSTQRYDCILPMASYLANKRSFYQWTVNHLRLYVQLQKDVNIDQFNAKIKNIIKENDKTVTSDAFLQPLSGYASVIRLQEWQTGRWSD